MFLGTSANCELKDQERMCKFLVIDEDEAMRTEICAMLRTCEYDGII